MNPLSDILSQKASELFSDTPSEPHKPMEENPVARQSVNQTEQHADLRAMIRSIKDQLDAILRVLDGDTVGRRTTPHSGEVVLETGERIVEGAFTGNSMRGKDGKEYPVPANYASKSKIVEGDRMKLTVTRSGSFIYKQIGPIDRKRLIGELVHDGTLDQWSVFAEGKPYKLLTASVTFHKGKSGDEAIILVSRDGNSSWGAVENIISK